MANVGGRYLLPYFFDKMQPLGPTLNISYLGKILIIASGQVSACSNKYHNKHLKFVVIAVLK